MMSPIWKKLHQCIVKVPAPSLLTGSDSVSLSSDAHIHLVHLITMAEISSNFWKLCLSFVFVCTWIQSSSHGLIGASEARDTRKWSANFWDSRLQRRRWKRIKKKTILYSSSEEKWLFLCYLFYTSHTAILGEGSEWGKCPGQVS